MEEACGSSNPLTLSSSNVEKVGGYALGGILGEGGFGKVYKGLNLETGQFAAVKVMTAHSVNISEIQQEIDILKRVEHPNIVKYLDCSDSSYKGKPYIIFEFIENGSLKDIIQKFGLFTEELCKRYLHQILKGLDFLHKKNILHRDIKAANILITKDGTCKLADFGVAAEVGIDQNEPTESAAGTLSWMAPEVFSGSTTNKSDIWSIGCLLCELYTGSPPYQGKTQIEVLYNILETEGAPLPEGISAKMADFLTQCFHRDPKHRPSAQQLLLHSWITSGCDSGQELKKPVQRGLMGNVRQRREAIIDKPTILGFDQNRKGSEAKKPTSTSTGTGTGTQFPFKQFASPALMDVFLEGQKTSATKIANSPSIPIDFKDDYLLALSLAAGYKEMSTQDSATVVALSQQRDKFLRQYLDLKKAFQIISERQDILEQSFSDEKLATLYYIIGNIEDLPKEAIRGVLMVKREAKGKWKKRAVASLDQFFLIYDHQNTEVPLEVYYLKTSLAVVALDKQETGFDHCFSVSAKSIPDAITLRAANNDILDKWMHSMRCIQQGTQSRLSPPTDMDRLPRDTPRPTDSAPIYVRKKALRTPTKSFSFSRLSSESDMLSVLRPKQTSGISGKELKQLNSFLGELTISMNINLTSLSRSVPGSPEIIELKEQMRKLKRVEAIMSGIVPIAILNESTPDLKVYKEEMKRTFKVKASSSSN